MSHQEKSRKKISIHALLAESDEHAYQLVLWVLRFLSTLSLRRATCQWRRSVKLFRQFLSTLSLRRATVEEVSGDTWQRDFYPRSPCGERLVSVGPLMYNLYFYPRSPCGERHILCVVSVQVGGFLSTLSLRRATVLVWCSCGGACDFYPRSPCGERLVSVGPLMYNLYFYPRSPCGERLIREPTAARNNKFLSTLSLRRATIVSVGPLMYNLYFYPRSPCGERRERR